MPGQWDNSGQDSCLRGISCPLGRVDAKGLKWALVDHEIYRSNGGCVAIATTDVPVILFAYVSDKAPQKKKGIHEKRGATFYHDAQVYWTIDDIVCQQEEGLTLTHTFYFNCYTPGGTIWWRYGGRTSALVAPGAPIWSASLSSFFHWDCESGAPMGPIFVDALAIASNGHAITVFPDLVNRLDCWTGDTILGIKAHIWHSTTITTDHQYARFHIVELLPDKIHIYKFVWSSSNVINSHELSEDWMNPTLIAEGCYVPCNTATYALLLKYEYGDYNWIIFWNWAGVIDANFRNPLRGWNYPFEWSATTLSCYSHQILGEHV